MLQLLFLQEFVKDAFDIFGRLSDYLERELCLPQIQVRIRHQSFVNRFVAAAFWRIENLEVWFWMVNGRYTALLAMIRILVPPAIPFFRIATTAWKLIKTSGKVWMIRSEVYLVSMKFLFFRDTVILLLERVLTPQTRNWWETQCGSTAMVYPYFKDSRFAFQNSCCV